jgi:uncharacterized phage protein
MKCPKCKGIGCVGATQDTCLACNGTGEIEQTNEEYLKSLNTEQLAEWLIEVTQHCFECGLNVNNSVLCPFGKCIDKEYAVKWLKEKTNESV